MGQQTFLFRTIIVILVVGVIGVLIWLGQVTGDALELTPAPVLDGSPFEWETPPGLRYNPSEPVPPSTGYPVLVTATPTPEAYPGSTAEAQSTPRRADADVTFVQARLADDGSWTFRVTVAHPDLGWEDYADGWDVILPDGSIVKPVPEDRFTRTLLHPHVEEQPVTREQSGIRLPPDVGWVTVRAHDSVDGFGGQEVVVDLSQTSGVNYQVQR